MLCWNPKMEIAISLWESKQTFLSEQIDIHVQMRYARAEIVSQEQKHVNRFLSRRNPYRYSCVSALHPYYCSPTLSGLLIHYVPYMHPNGKFVQESYLRDLWIRLPGVCRLRGRGRKLRRNLHSLKEDALVWRP